ARIRDGAPEERRAAWAEQLRGLPGTPAEQGETLWSALLESARRVGLVAAADLRFAARMITRLDESLPKLQTVGKIDDLDEFIATCAPVRGLLGFAVTPLFGKLLHGQAG